MKVFVMLCGKGYNCDCACLSPMTLVFLTKGDYDTYFPHLIILGVVQTFF